MENPRYIHTVECFSSLKRKACYIMNGFENVNKSRPFTHVKQWGAGSVGKMLTAQA